MKLYCKAFLLSDVRRFADWAAGALPAEGELGDEDVVYVCDDFTVLTNPIQEEGLIFDRVTPEWREFCATELKFAIPEDLAFAYSESSGTAS